MDDGAISDVKKALLQMRLRQSQQAKTARAKLEPVARDGALPLSFNQEYLWFLDQITPGLQIYNVPFVLRLTGELDVAALSRAVTALVQRHEVLRTRFAATHGVPHQVIDPAPDDVPLPCTDLRELDPDEREQAWPTRMREAINAPFDLAADRLIRTELLRLADDEYVFLLTVHHIIVDGWSLGRLAGELSELYDGFRSGTPATLSELGLQYADYASWQRRHLAGPQLDAQLAYWTQQLDELPVLDFPADRPRPARREWAGRTYEKTIPAELYRGVHALARAEKATLLGVLYSAFLVVLHRYTGQDDLVVGTVLGGRSRPELQPLIGYFVNSLVLRADAGGDPSARELIGRANAAAIGAMGHQDVPFGKIVDAVRAERDPSRNPLFQVSFTLQSGAGSIDFAFGGLDVEWVEIPGETARFDIAFQIEDRADGGGQIWIEYSTELFDRPRMARLAEHFCTVLAQIVADPSRRLSELSLIGADEARELVRGRNPAPVAHETDGLLLHELVERHARRDPGHPALLFGDRTMTFGELDARANRLAQELRATYAIGADALVGILLDRGPELPYAQLGTLKAGGAWLPLDAANPSARIAFQLADAEAKVLITSAALATEELRAAVGVPVLVLEEAAGALAARAPVAPPEVAGPDNLAYVIYTSGSTGKPKGVMISHRSAVNFVSTCGALFAITPADRLLQFANPAFDVSVFDIYAALGCGAGVVSAPKDELLDPQKLTELIRRQQVTVTDLPPTVLGLLDPARLPHLRVLFVGLEPFPGELVNTWNRDGRQFHNGYGPTEATVACIDYLCPPGTLRSMPPIGVAMANHRAYVLDSALQPVPDGVPGELYVAGAGLARGYRHRPALTAERFLPDPYGPPGERMYRTGDLVRWRDDGNLEFIGRADGQIKIRGLRIEPGEIEHALRTHPEVHQTAVIAAPAPGGTAQQLVAYVVGPAAATAEKADELRGFLAALLPPHMVPAVFVGLDALPLTPNGKLDRSRLPTTGAATVTGPSEPSTDTQRQVIAVVRDVLDLSSAPVGLQDSFFDLGGNSLNMIRMAARLRDTFGVEVDAREILVGPRMHRIADTIDERRATRDSTAPAAPAAGAAPEWIVPIRATGTRPPLFCLHASGGSAVPYVPLAQHLDPDQPVYGVEAAGLHGEPVPETVPALAAHYLRGIRAVVPHGPYRLAGWSVGGTVALEIATQLREAGESVEALVLLDCALPPGTGTAPHAELVAGFVHDLAGLSGRPQDEPDLKALAGEPSDTVFEDAVLKQLEAAGLVPAGMREDLRTRLHSYLSTVRAFLTFQPRPYDGTVWQCIAAERDEDYHRGWERLATRLVPEQIPGTHYTILQAPNVRRTGAVVQGFLDDAAAAAKG